MNRGIDRRAFAGLALAAAAAPRSMRAAQRGELLLADWGDPIVVREVQPGEWLIARIDGDPLFLRRRTPSEIDEARATPLSALTDPAPDEARAPDGEWLAVSGLCTHARCEVQAGLGPYRGWHCFCHGSTYDLSGRVREGPAKRNLPIIPHVLGDGTMVLSPP